MKTKVLVLLVLATALILAGFLFRQEREEKRLRAVIAELMSLPRVGPAASIVTNPLPAEIAKLRREAAEVHRLRAEVTQLRREKVEMSALLAKIEKDGSTLHGNSRQSLDSLGDLGEFNDAATGNSVVSRAISLAQLSPAEAARWVAALPRGKEQEQATLAVIEHWMAIDPAAAGAWTTQFPEGPLRERAMSAVARAWGLRDWNATAGWLEALPPGSSREAAIGAFVTSADGYDIRLAVEWANRMESPEHRAMRVENTAGRWLREDPEAARAWLESAQLPSGVAERLLSVK